MLLKIRISESKLKSKENSIYEVLETEQLMCLIKMSGHHFTLLHFSNQPRIWIKARLFSLRQLIDYK